MGVRDGATWGDGGMSEGYVVGCVGGTYGGGGGVRWGGRVDTLGRGGVYTLGGGTLGDGGTLGRGVGVDVRSWSKMLFLGTFWKITTYWPPLDERVRSSFA